MLIKDIMTSPVITISPEASLLKAAQLMLEHGVSGVPVVDADGQLCGIITEGDFLRRAELGTEVRRPRWLEYFGNTGKVAADYVRAHGRRVEEVMQTRPVTCAPGEAVADAIEVMLRRRIKRLPVVENGRVVGIVARADLLKALQPLLAAQAATTPTDAELKAEIDRQLAGQTWRSVLIRTAVADGVVTLTGTVYDERQQAAAHVLVENIAGVKAVVDHLHWIEPSGATAATPVDPDKV